MKKNWLMILVFVLLSSCAGWERGCASCNASNFGADWIVVQFDAYGTPFGCWVLQNKSVSNEEHSDGVYWVSNNGHLVHISGFYNRVQVTGNAWESAYHELGITEDDCKKVRLRPHASGVSHGLEGDSPHDDDTADE